MSHNTKIHKKQGGDELVINGELIIGPDGIISAAGTQANAITTLGDSATGAEIAAAVNSIIAALVGVGIAKAAE